MHCPVVSLRAATVAGRHPTRRRSPAGQGAAACRSRAASGPQEHLDGGRLDQVAPPAFGLRSPRQDHHGVLIGGILYGELERSPRGHAPDAQGDQWSVQQCVCPGTQQEQDDTVVRRRTVPGGQEPAADEPEDGAGDQTGECGQGDDRRCRPVGARQAGAEEDDRHGGCPAGHGGADPAPRVPYLTAQHHRLACAEQRAHHRPEPDRTAEDEQQCRGGPVVLAGPSRCRRGPRPHHASHGCGDQHPLLPVQRRHETPHPGGLEPTEGYAFDKTATHRDRQGERHLATVAGLADERLRGLRGARGCGHSDCLRDRAQRRPADQRERLHNQGDAPDSTASRLPAGARRRQQEKVAAIPGFATPPS